MATHRIDKGSQWGMFYVKKPDGRKWQSYYATIDVLRPLLKAEGFQEKVIGFYLNISGDCYDTVRISYFVNSANGTVACAFFEDFFKRNGLLQVTEPTPPRQIIVAEKYGSHSRKEGSMSTILTNGWPPSLNTYRMWQRMSSKRLAT